MSQKIPSIPIPQLIHLSVTQICMCYFTYLLNMMMMMMMMMPLKVLTTTSRFRYYLFRKL